MSFLTLFHIVGETAAFWYGSTNRDAAAQACFGNTKNLIEDGNEVGIGWVVHHRGHP
jgi:hypothetical protein